MRLAHAAAALVFVCVSATAQTNLVVNGGFEDNGGLASNTFTGWTVVDQAGGSGTWVAQAGNSAVGHFGCKNEQVQPPPSGFAAMSIQSDPGSHILYQDVTIPSSAAGVVLSYDLFYNSVIAFSTPPTLDYRIRVNQQFRVDIVDPAAPVADVGSGVLANVYQTKPEDPLVLPAYATHTFALSPFAGRTIRLRFAEVDNGNCFLVGLDNVSIMVTATCPASAPGTMAISYRGESSTCGVSNEPCTTGEGIVFSAATTGYTLQSCDTATWDFGDGSTSSTPTPTHVYSSAATYTVHLQVTNSLGTQTAAPVTVTVIHRVRRHAAGH